MTKIVIIGGGVVGAAIAYELSADPTLEITLIEKQTPASGSTGRALGVLMGIISHKIKGRQWRLRQNSLNRYETLIPELKALTGDTIPYNRQGILKLLDQNEDLEKWQKLVNTRKEQGYPLEILNSSQIIHKFPHLNLENFPHAVYSSGDRQLNPQALTHALIKGASLRGVNCKFGFNVQNILCECQEDPNKHQCTGIQTKDGIINLDYLIIAAGLGSTHLTTHLQKTVNIQPVLGQALKLSLDSPIARDFSPVITANDVHIVPLGGTDYWVGATVEFPNEQGNIPENPQLLETVREAAIAFCPFLKAGEIVQTWSGKRPRPQGQGAPIIQWLEGYDNVILGTGHYRNGVLLAAATALEVKVLLEDKC
ncbi:MAG: NAD(P)/FAD-dependent oxidoreductase [Microcystaceae cyanobacterium]